MFIYKCDQQVYNSIGLFDIQKICMHRSSKVILDIHEPSIFSSIWLTDEKAE